MVGRSLQLMDNLSGDRLHEVKYDGYRLRLERDSDRVVSGGTVEALDPDLGGFLHAGRSSSSA
jgi:hypothetical protein